VPVVAPTSTRTTRATVGVAKVTSVPRTESAPTDCCATCTVPAASL